MLRTGRRLFDHELFSSTVSSSLFFVTEFVFGTFLVFFKIVFSSTLPQCENGLIFFLQGVQVDDEEEQQEICDRKYAWSVCDVAPCIATLPLPPDYIQQELEELVCNTDMKYTADA